MSGNFAPLNCLQGVRVVDLTQFEAGPTCTEALAWLGAEVVKIENPKSGDPGRRIAASNPNNPDSFYFKILNANKKSATVDLKTPEGVKLVKELVKKADVFAENLAPGTIERLGLGYDVLKEINPGIIYCQVKGFGEGSPYEKSLAFDMIAQACGGTMSVTGEPGRQPCKPGATIGDTGTGMLMAISVLGALYEKRATGKGRRLQLAMQDAVMHYIRTSFAVMNQQGNKEAAPRMGAQSTSGAPAPCGIYPTKPFGYNDYVYIFCSRANPEHGPVCSRSSAARTCSPIRASPLMKSATRTKTSSTRSSPSGRASTPRKRRCRSSAPPGCPPARCTTRWNCRTTRASRTAASCRRCTTRTATGYARPGRYASTASRPSCSRRRSSASTPRTCSRAGSAQPERHREAAGGKGARQLTTDLPADDDGRLGITPMPPVAFPGPIYF